MPNESQSRNKSECKTHMSGWLTAWAHTQTRIRFTGLHSFAINSKPPQKQFFRLINDLNCKLDGSSAAYFISSFSTTHTHTHTSVTLFRFVSSTYIFIIYINNECRVLYSSGSYRNLNDCGMKKFIIVGAFFFHSSFSVACFIHRWFAACHTYAVQFLSFNSFHLLLQLLTGLICLDFFFL